jgi:2-dehydropantoate 2-reductase
MTGHISDKPSIAIVGAGAVGIALFCSLRAGEADCDLITRDLQPREFRLETRNQSYSFFSAPSAGRQYDIVISTVKRYDTGTAALFCASALKKDGCLLTVQNGLDADIDYACHIPRHLILRSALYTFAERSGVYVSTLKCDTLVLYIEDKPEASLLPGILQTPEIEIQLVRGMRYESWKKLVVSSSLSALCACAGVDIAGLCTQPRLLDTLEILLREGKSLYAAVHGGDALRLDLAGLKSQLAVVSRDFRPSLYVDIMRHEANELEWLNGRLLYEGKAIGMQLPTHERLYMQLREMSADSD